MNRMLRALIAVTLGAVLFATSPLVVDATGGMAIGRDLDGVTRRAEIHGSLERRSMTRLPFGTYLARPFSDGTIAFICKNGKVVERGYVTMHMTTVEVIRKEDCAQTSSTKRP